MTPEVDETRDILLREGLVKICGLRQPEHAAFAAAAGADLLGFIFAPARRQVTAETARACIEAARSSGGGRQIVAVGVFVDADIEAVAAAARTAGLDAVQLHGNEAPEFVDSLGSLGIPSIKALRLRNGADAAVVLAEMDEYDVAGRSVAGFLIDSYDEGASGGTGVRADWDVAAAISARRPVTLAGGLDPDNVAEAIARVRPLGVDVSSGVETGGIKDPARIEAFIRQAKAAFAQQSEQVR